MTVAPKLRVLDLFSGIGGFSLGLERAGMETVAFCEQDGYARRVLRKHWPHVWLYEDVRTLTAKRLRQDGIPRIDVVCGGFPCQDISAAGKGEGLGGARSGLWSEMLRLVRETRPRWVVAENVPALRSRGADRVIFDLEGAGYAVRPVVVGAWAVGGNHQRERAWFVANANRVGRQSPQIDRRPARLGPVGEGSALGITSSLWGRTTPGVCRKDDGIPGGSHRRRCLGNSVVPLIPELIGRFIQSAASTPLLTG